MNNPTPASAAGSCVLRILVLDDEEIIRTLTQRALASAGCSIECVTNGREGLQVLLQRQFDVLVVDLHMRGMDGITFLHEALKIWPWLGVVIMSGFITKEVKAQLLDMNISRFVEKPVEMDSLIEQVQAEAREKRALLHSSEQLAPERIQNQLGMLRTLGEMALSSENLVEALRGLGAGLGRMLPCSVVGILDLDRDDSVLILNCQEPVSKEYIEHMKADMLRHYASLSGRPLAEGTLRVQLEGEARSPRGPSAPASVFAVPIIIGGELRGLLNLTSSKANALAPTDIAFLYHAANQLSTVLVALNRARELAIRDSVTSVFNRRHLETQLEHAWKLAERYSYIMGIAVIDLDHFKQINDNFGHIAGDQLLREFGEMLKRVARATDVIGRYGGDEFVVILSKLDGHAVSAFGERLLNAVRQHVFCEKTLRLHMSCTLGVATSQQLEEPRDPQHLLQLADYALYAAKRAGRNRQAIWSPDMTATRATEVEVPESKPATPVAPAAAPQSKGHVLVVDDDELLCQLTARILKVQGYEAVSVQSGADARARVAAQPGYFDVALVDLKLGPEDGLQVIDDLRAMEPYLAHVIITGYASLDNAVASLRHGAYDFVQKPFTSEHLGALVERAHSFKRLRQENARYQLHLEDMVREKSAALSEALAQVKQSYDFTLEALAAMLDAREHTTGQHSQRARKLTLLLARELGLPPELLDDIGRGALLHDIGKTGIPDEILLNTERLTAEQRQIMERHPEIGYNIVSAAPYLAKAAEVVLAHHERFDGTGYPRGLRGHDIPLGARIFTVVDAYDAMRSTRFYHQPRTPAAALAEIQNNSGTQFDPAVVEVFLRCHPQIEALGGWEPGS
jgi:diguanylate cyclase (GGDEF)-like protein/putative nucleotidyltransferase with HDIG domain